jgi:hypothetical protein
MSTNVYRWRCKDCLTDLSNRKERRQHCCCLINWSCPGHDMKINHCAGECQECGWGGCVCGSRHCCCQEKDLVGYRFHEWIHEFIDMTLIRNHDH